MTGPATLQALALAPQALLQGVAGVLTDIDDTLTRDGAIEPEALAALQALQGAGLPVVAVTGRPAGWSEPFALAWPVLAIVAENGGVMLRRTAQGLVHEFTTDEATRAQRWRALQACAADVLRQVPGALLARDSAGRLTDIAVDHSEFTQLAPEATAQVVALMRAHGLQATVSSIHINGWLGTHNKWTGAQWALQRCLGQALQPGQRDWVFVGDSTNDQLMFQHLPFSVGVANIARFVPQLVHPPAWVTRAERGQGFAELTAALLQARQPGAAEH